MKKVLAFFGAFNPPTSAHLILSEHAMRETGRDGVIFVPSKMKYIEEEQGKSFAFRDAARYQMLQTAASTRPWMKVTDLELREQEQPRSYTTLCRLRDEGFSPSLLMGSDKLSELQKIWMHVEEIVEEFGIVVMSRNHDKVLGLLEKDPYLCTLRKGITVVETPDRFHTVSSTAVREKLAAVRALEAEIRDMVPAEIYPLIMEESDET